MPNDAIARQAEECAFVLWTDFRDRLTDDEAQRMLDYQFLDGQDLNAAARADIFAVHQRLVAGRI